MNKKLFAVIAAVSLSASVFATEVEMSFANEVSSDIVNVTMPKDGETTAEFAGIEDNVAVEFKSEKVDAGLDITFNFATNKTTKDGSEYTFAAFSGYQFNDYYIEFRPVSILTLGFSDVINTDGSYLPVEDDNVGNGNLGSDFVLCFRPVAGLRLAAGMDFISYIGHKDEKGPLLNFGVDYTSDKFSFGAATRNVIADFAFGVFGAFTGVDGLNLTAGFSYNDDFCDIAGNILSFGASYDITDSISTGLDLVTNFGNNDADAKDLYCGAAVTVGINDAIETGLACTFKTDFDADDSYEVGIAPEFAYALGNNTFKVGADIGLSASETTLAFPISWEYAF
ncbi:MAG: hypothetical protein K5829_10790 [Treponema sp.]|nr:hypothetical protein [Treponema sp.]